jgi:hypothetical protein
MAKRRSSSTADQHWALSPSNIELTCQTPLIGSEAHDWLFNWRGTFHTVMSVLIQRQRDYVQKGESVFAFEATLLQTKLDTVQL